MFDSFNGLEMVFIACAAIGGFFVVVRLVLQFAGAGSHGDTGVDVSGHGAVDAHHADSDLGFKFLSIHGLSTFLLMFGLMGLALHHQSQVGAVFSLAGAVVAGTVAVWIIGKLFQGAARLQSSGTLETRHAVGSTGTVYLTIPEKGVGRVNISFQGRLREFDAMEKNGNVLPTGTPVQVVNVNASILVVEKL